MLAVTMGGQGFRMPPLLVVGNPGAGKSCFLKRLAALSGVPSTVLNAHLVSAQRLVSEHALYALYARLPVDEVAAAPSSLHVCAWLVFAWAAATRGASAARGAGRILVGSPR